MAHFEQVHGEVGAVVDHYTLTIDHCLLAKEAAALGEEIEGTLRVVDLEAGYLFCQTNDEVLATLEGLTHLLDALLRTSKGGFCCLLADGAWAAGVLSLQLVAALHNPFGRCDETDAPACHGVCLADAVDDDHSLLYFGELSHAGMFAHVVDVLVNLVGNDDDLLVTEQHVLQCLEFLLAIDGACWIAGRAEDECLCLGCDGSFELLGRDLEVLLG